MMKISLLALLVLVASGAQAATLNFQVIGGQNQLMGASGVMVDGNPYNVEFVDGTCIALFSGCNDASDFTFNTETSAQAAAQALLDQVYCDGCSDPYDAHLHPDLTNGLGDPAYGEVGIPFIAQNPIPDYVATHAVWFTNSAWLVNQAQVNFTPSDSDTSLSSVRLYVGWARWSPVPEPSTGLLVGFGLAGFAAQGCRRNRS